MTQANFRLAQAKVHFIGIGGIGMCGLAELLHNMGASVTGSDVGENLQTQRLESLGIPVYKGHHADNLALAEVVVYSSAVKPDNAEYVEARKRQVPLIRRAEALAEIMRLKRGIAVAGTHGKTTTTSLTASIFLAAQQDPTIVVGGRLDVIKSTAQLGQGDWLIAEADESDGSFLRLAPEVVIITNIDNDHLDHYGDFKRLQEAFVDFAQQIPFYGAAIVCGDDAKTKTLFRDFPKKIIFYGEKSDNDVVLKVDPAGPGRYQMWEIGAVIGQFELPLPGRHNALNACAAILASRAAGLEMSVACAGVAQFKGVDRRFQHKAKIRGIEFYDDYGHHPTEVEAVLSGFKERFPEQRVVVIFQPHRYSRTQICWEQFRTCFKRADQLFLLDIYPAGEKPIQDITSVRLASEMDHTHCQYISRQEDPELNQVATFLQEGDVVVTLGAGDVVKLGERLMDKLAKS
ncbi:MAG: UDP-N-acetylmuramate--L-alanine ligase [Bdellovibrionales bacterium]